MTSFIPFKGVRPTRDKANLVATRSYLSYTKQILNEKLNNNPFTFLHILNPDYKSKKPVIGKNKFSVSYCTAVLRFFDKLGSNSNGMRAKLSRYRYLFESIFGALYQD